MEGWVACHIVNKSVITDTYFPALKITNLWTNITYKFIITDCCVQIYDVTSPRYNLLMSIDIEQRKDLTINYICNVRPWNLAPTQLDDIIDAQDTFNAPLSLEAIIISSFDTYNTNPSLYEANKYRPNALSSMDAQAIQKLYITPTVRKRNSDPSLQGITVLTKPEYQAVASTRQASRNTALDIWKIANGWTG